MSPEQPMDPADARRARNHLELVSRWADDLAHEIKNPFHAMVINLELVRRRAGDAEGLRERAEVVETELHRVHDLIDAVLRMVRPWPATASANADAVYDALEPAIRARASRRDIAYSREGQAGTVAVPPGDLTLIVLNLVDNGLDAAAGALTVRLDRADDEIRLRITDDGAGPGGEADPFEPGFTTRDGRSGLGLGLCRRLAEDAGGSLDLTRDDDGTTALVRLPTASSA